MEGTGRDAMQVNRHYLDSDVASDEAFWFDLVDFFRSTQDCTWMDPNLLCQDYEMDFSMSVSCFNNLLQSIYFSSSQRAWFGGDFMSIIGECECR